MAKPFSAASHASARGVMIVRDLTVFKFFSNAFKPCLQTKERKHGTS